MQDKSAGMMGMGKGMLGKGMDEKPLGEVRRADNRAADRKFLEPVVKGFVAFVLKLCQQTCPSTAIGQ